MCDHGKTSFLGIEGKVAWPFRVLRWFPDVLDFVENIFSSGTLVLLISCGVIVLIAGTIGVMRLFKALGRFEKWN